MTTVKKSHLVPFKKDSQETVPVGKTYLDVFPKLSTITKEKLDRAVEYLNQKRVMHKKFKPAGIDPTRGGEYMTHDQFVVYEAKVKALITEYEALKQVLMHFKAHVMPKNVFDKMRMRSGLFALEPSVFDNWYLVPPTGQQYLDRQAQMALFRKREEEERQKAWALNPEAIPVLAIFALSVVLCFISTVLFKIYGFFNHIGVFGTLLLAICLLGGYYFLADPLRGLREKYEAKRAQKEAKREAAAMRTQINKNVETLKGLFSGDYTMRNQVGQTEDSLKRTLSRRTVSAVQVNILPPENPKISDEMERVFTAVPDQPGWTVWTVADPKCIGYTLRNRIEQKPRHFDPGLVVQYKNFVAVIPTTWYNITPLEQSFIDEIMEVAEEWDARSYLAN